MKYDPRVGGEVAKVPKPFIGPVRQCDDPAAYWDDIVEHEGDWQTCPRCAPNPPLVVTMSSNHSVR